MNFHQLSKPTPKRLSAESSLKVFPIDRIPGTDDEKPFIGIYTGLSVEIIDPESIKRIYSDGCFGLSTKTKNMPQTLAKFSRVKNLNQSQYEQKLALNEKLTNQNPNLVMVNLTPAADQKNVEQSLEANENIKLTADEPEPMEIAEEIKEPEVNLIADPFPIEETLALLPEEAFFLHHSLRCLRIFDFDQTHEFTTEELLSKFCDCDSKFIERFIAYQYYRSKNWVVKSGLKFGGDFRK